MSNCKRIEVLLIKIFIFMFMTFKRSLVVKKHRKDTLALVNLHQKGYLSSSSTV